MGGGGTKRTLWILVAVPLGLALAGDRAAVEAREYSPYLDPAKPVLSFLLSDPQDAQEFQKKFGLSGEEMEAVLAATRKENRKLAEKYAESERIVAANRDLSKERIAGKVAASNYEEEVEAAVAETKTSIEAVLPRDGEAGLRKWVDREFAEERREYSEESSVAYRLRPPGLPSYGARSTPRNTTVTPGTRSPCRTGD